MTRTGLSFPICIKRPGLQDICVRKANRACMWPLAPTAHQTIHPWGPLSKWPTMGLLRMRLPSPPREASRRFPGCVSASLCPSVLAVRPLLGTLAWILPCPGLRVPNREAAGGAGPLRPLLTRLSRSTGCRVHRQDSHPHPPLLWLPSQLSIARPRPLDSSWYSRGTAHTTTEPARPHPKPPVSLGRLSSGPLPTAALWGGEGCGSLLLPPLSPMPVTLLSPETKCIAGPGPAPLLGRQGQQRQRV